MPRQARLVYSTPEGEREVVLDPVQETSIGRHPACTITVSQPSVSRKHARLWFEGGGFYVEDLGSSNGTWVNNQRVTRASLTDGDELRCGDFAMRYGDLPEGTREEPSPALAMVAPPPVDRPAAQAAPRVVGTLRPGARLRPSEVPRSPASPEVAVQPRPVGKLSAAGRLPPRPAEPARPPTVEAPRAPEPARPQTPPAVVPAADASELERLRRDVEHWKAMAEGRALLEGDGGQAELLAARQRADAAERALADLRAAGDPAQRELAELRADLDDRGRRIAELESAKLRADEQLNTQADRSLQLKEQVHAQQAQLEEYRREKAALEMGLAEARQHIADLKSVQEATTGRENELADLVNDLKREVRQQEKKYKEVERQLDLAEYNLRAAREENENLRLALGEDDSTRKGLNTTIDHLRQVLSEKEGMIERLHLEVGRWEERAHQAEAMAREDAGAAAARLSDQIATLRGERDELARQNDALARELEAARAPSGRVMTQINELKRENRDLRNALDEARAGAGADDGRLAELQAALEATGSARRAAEDAERRARAELDALRGEVERLRQRPAAAAPAGNGLGELKAAAIATYEALNDLASDLRMSIEVAGDHVRELEPVVERLATLPPGGLDPALAAALEEVDAAFTIESARETLQNAQDRSEDFKQAMRRFRETLQRFGYGS